MRPEILIAVLSVLFLLTSAGAVAQRFSATVTYVFDGDTVQVQRRNGNIERIRLFGIDAPESDQPYGRAATQEMRMLAHDNRVTVHRKGRDQYGRIIGVIVTREGSVNLNRAMVRRGLAWHYRQYAPNAHALRAYQLMARTRRIGLWSSREPVAPWEWRRR